MTLLTVVFKPNRTAHRTKHPNAPKYFGLLAFGVVGALGLMVWADWKGRKPDEAQRSVAAQRRAAEARLRRRRRGAQ